MKFVYLKEGKKAEVVELKGKRKLDYETMKSYMDYDCMTVATRKIGDHYYDIFLDDEGLLRPEEKRIIGGVCVDECDEMLIGTLIICKSDKVGNSIGLKDEEIEEVMRNMLDLDEISKFKGRPIEDTIVHGYWDGGCYTAKAHSHIVAYRI